MQCFIQLCVIVEQSFSSSESWVGAFTNSIHICSKQKKFDQGYDFWEQIFCGSVNSCNQLITNAILIKAMKKRSK